MYTKYPRTPHLPFSKGATSDDRVLADMRHFEGHEVVVTEKMDGENTTMYRDHIHARSLDSADHPSRSWVKAFHGRIRHDIPEGWRVCGENLFAEHSLHYSTLASYFLGFSVWNDQNVCLSWDDTEEWAALLGIDLVPVLYRGTFDVANITASWCLRYNDWESEGYVVRLAKAFRFEDFSLSTAKWVRRNHVKTDEHWMTKAVVPNGLRSYP